MYRWPFIIKEICFQRLGKKTDYGTLDVYNGMFKYYADSTEKVLDWNNEYEELINFFIERFKSEETEKVNTPDGPYKKTQWYYYDGEVRGNYRMMEMMEDILKQSDFLKKNQLRRISNTYIKSITGDKVEK